MDAEDHRFRQTILTEAVGKSAKSLQRMLGPKGNPTAESLFAMIKAPRTQSEALASLFVKSYDENGESVWPIFRQSRSGPWGS